MVRSSRSRTRATVEIVDVTVALRVVSAVPVAWVALVVLLVV